MPKLAIAGGKPLRTKPFAPWPHFDQGEIEAVTQVIKSRYWGGYPHPAPIASRFGKAFAAYHDAKYGIVAANGTVTLEMALKACGIEPRDEVIVPPFTFVATASAVLAAGGIPVFADVEERSWCLDPKEVERKITGKTRAVVAVHLGMNAADLDELTLLCKKHGLKLIEDCAHAHGGKWRGKGLGSWGDAGSFSFQTTKLMTCGEGGIVLTSDERIKEGVEVLVNCGRPPHPDRYKIRRVGNNYRLTELQAAILEKQLLRLASQTALRQKRADQLTRGLAKIPGIRTFARDPRLTTRHCYQYLFKFDEAAHDGVARDAFVAALASEGIPCEGHFYDPLYLMEIFQPKPAEFAQLLRRSLRFLKERCPVAEQAALHEAVWLPHQILLGPESDVRDVVRAVEKVVANIHELKGLRSEAIAEKSSARVTRRSR